MKKGDLYLYVNKYVKNLPHESLYYLHYLTKEDSKKQVNACTNELERMLDYYIEDKIIYILQTECVRCGKIFDYHSISQADFLCNHKKVSITIKI